MNSATTISLDVALNNAPPTVYAKQGDKGSRFVLAKLYDHGTAIAVPQSELNARLRVCKPDKTVAFNNDPIMPSSGQLMVSVELTEQILAVAGTAVADIGLYQDDTLLSTFKFYIFIEKSAVPDDYIVSSDEFGALIDALAEADSAVSIATEAAEAAAGAASSAGDAASAANTAAARAEAAASAVGEEIDGIVLKDEDTNEEYLLKFRIRDDAPYIDIYDI